MKMPKGRNFAPCIGNTGLWYKHSTNSSTLQTNKELLVKQNETASVPEFVEERLNHECGHRNKFSKHDNRHLLQENGEYFGQGFGKRILNGRSQHRTLTTLKTNTGDELGLRPKTSYQSSYTERPLNENCKHKRFPRIFASPCQANESGNPLTTTTKWWPDAEQGNHKTSTQVLAITQEIPSKSNLWKYSYQSTIFPFIATKQGAKQVSTRN